MRDSEGVPEDESIDERDVVDEAARLSRSARKLARDLDALSEVVEDALVENETDEDEEEA